MNQDMMKNLGALAGGIYKIGDDKREKQAKQFDEDVKKKRKGYLDKIDMFGDGTQGQIAAQQALDAYDEEMSKRRESILNRGFTDYLGFGDDPSSPSAKLDDVADPFAEENQPGTEFRDAYKASLQQQNAQGSSGPRMFAPTPELADMASLAEEEEAQEKGFLSQKGLTSYDPLIGRYNKSDLKRNTDIRDKAEQKQALVDVDLSMIPKLGEANRKEELASLLEVRYNGKVSDAKLTELAKTNNANLAHKIVEMDMVQKKQNQLDLLRLKELSPEELKVKVAETLGVGGAKMSLAIGEYASKQGIDYHYALKEITELGPEKLKNLIDEINQTSVPKAKAAEMMALATGRAENLVQLQRARLLNPEILRQARAMKSMELGFEKRRFQELGKQELEERSRILVEQTMLIGDAALRREAVSLGIVKLDQEGNPIKDADGRFVTDVSKINEARINGTIDEFEQKMEKQLEADIDRAESTELLKGEVTRLKAIKKAEYSELRDHEVALAKNPDLLNAMIDKQEALLQLEDRFARSRETRQDIRESKKRYIEQKQKIEDEIRGLKLDHLMKGFSNLHRNGGSGPEGKITAKDLAPYAEALQMGDDELAAFATNANTLGAMSKKDNIKALASNPLLTPEQQFNLLKRLPLSDGGFKGSNIKFTDWKQNKTLLDGIVKTGGPISDVLMEAAGITTPAQKEAIEQIAGYNKEQETLKSLNERITEHLGNVSPLGFSEEDIQKRREFSTKLHKELSEDERFRPLLEKHGITPQSLSGQAEDKAREVQKDLADIQYKTASATNKAISKGSTKLLPPDKAYEDGLKKIFDRYGNDSEQIVIETTKLQNWLSNAHPGWTPYPGTTAASGQNSVKNAPPKKGENKPEETTKETTPEETQPETTTQPGDGFVSKISEPKTAKQAAVSQFDPKIKLNSDSALTGFLSGLDSFFGNRKGDVRENIDRLSKEEGSTDGLFLKLGEMSDNEIYDYLANNGVKGGPAIKNDIIQAVARYRDFNNSVILK